MDASDPHHALNRSCKQGAVHICERSEALAPSDSEAVVIDFTDVEPFEKPETVS